MKDQTDDRGGTPSAEPSPARAIEVDSEGRRPLRAILDDARALYTMAVGRVWKGNPHPDFMGAAKALALEAQLSGYLTEKPKGAVDPALDDVTLEAELGKLGYVKKPTNGNGKRLS